MNERIDADELAIYRAAIKLGDNMIAWSRTPKAG